MGLKTTNYEIKAKRHILPEAYAVIGRVGEIDEHGNGYAIMHIQSTRENALNADPFETKRVDFVWDRKSDIASTIYESAKVPKYTRRINAETHKIEMVITDPMFKDWDNDIVVEEPIEEEFLHEFIQEELNNL